MRVRTKKTFFLKWGHLLCIFSLTFLLFYLYTKHFISWDIYTLRDILRAQGWLEGRFHWLGPELTGGKNLPGPFFYFLLFPPLMFGESIYNQSLLWYLSWLALSYTLVFSFVRKIVKHKESFFIFLIAFITTIGSGLFRPLSYGWNPGFAILFHILALMGLYYWRETNRRFYLYLVGLVIALGIQVHILVSVHIVTAFLLYFLSKPKKLLPLFLFLFLASFPILLYSIMNYFHIFEDSSLRSADYLTYLKSSFLSKPWLINVKKVFDFSYMEPLVFVLLMTFWKQWKTKKWPLSQSMENLLIMIIIPCFTGILIARHSWYIYFTSPLLIILLTKWCDELMPDPPDKKLNFLLICGFIFFFPLFLFGNITDLFSFNNLLGAVGDHYITVLIMMSLMFLLVVHAVNQEWTYKNIGKVAVFFMFFIVLGQMKIIKSMKPQKHFIGGYISQTWLSYQYVDLFMKRIFLETNWSPKEAMKRIYAIGISPEISLFSYYSLAKENVKKKDHNKLLKEEDSASLHPGLKNSKPSLKKPDGYLIIKHLELFTDYSKKDWKQHLSHSYLLADSIRQEITKGQILITTPTLYYDSYWLIPYKTTKESAFVNGFHNIGQPYYWEEPEWLKNCTSTWQFKNKDELYYCMILPGYLQRAGIHIKLSENISSVQQSYLNISFFGPLLGAAFCCSNSDGFALWSDIEVKLLCDETYYRYSIPNMGNIWNRKDYNFLRQPLLSPLKLQIPVKNFSAFSDSSLLQASSCKKENIKQIEITFTHSHKKFLTKESAPEEKRIVWNP